MIDGHMHLENGPLTVEYAMKYVEAGVKAGMDTHTDSGSLPIGFWSLSRCMTI